jgi:hypothetical protein
MPKCFKCSKPMPGNNGRMLCQMCKERPIPVTSSSIALPSL